MSHNIFVSSDLDSPSASSSPSASGSSNSLNYDDPDGHRSRLTEAQILSKIHHFQLQLEACRAERDDDRTDHGPPPPSSSSQSFQASDSLSSSPHTPRIIVVSNRLPVTVNKNESGDWNFRVSSGGLVSALAGVKSKIPFIWVGWTGMEVASSDQDLMKARFLDEMNCYPVFLTEEDSNLYYNGFCNDVLWPLFHYVPLPIVSSDGERKFDVKYWHAYAKANHRFADAVLQVYQPGDLVWVQDYHLMLLPSLLRKRLPDVTIGFFLHTPFPSSEVYRILPVRNKVLQGVLAADLIGFHTYDYASHFLSVCTRILGLESSPKGVKYKDHFAFVGIFPIGTDPDAWLNGLQSASVKERILDVENKFRGKKVVLGVDRLDYIKGVPHKLMAFEIFLANHPEWQHNVVLIQIGVPSRTEVDVYKKVMRQTNELVGRINAQYGSVEQGSPIIFITKSVNFDDLCALYAVADVALVTSIRDGMNLVSYEYVVCQQDRHGVLVLSEFAGSAQSLSSAIRVNPWNIEELASALHEALTLPERERRLKHQRLFQYVKKHTAAFWAHSFINELKQIEKNMKAQDVQKPMQSLLRVSVDVLPEMRVRQRRLFLIEYEGTLVEPVALPDLAIPSVSLLRFLQRLSSEAENYIYIISGRTKETLEGWFGELNVGLICEHGCDYVHPGGEEWQTVTEASNQSWKESVIPILQYFKERTPGAHLETKEKTITWHFRDADPLFGSWQAKELQLLLAESCVNLPVEVISGPKYLELRPENVSRAAAVQRIISERPDGIDFAFAIGSDKADEEVFSFLSNCVRTSDGRVFTLTCRVGGKSDNSSADKYVPDSDVVFRILKDLAPSHTYQTGMRKLKPASKSMRGSRFGSHRRAVGSAAVTDELVTNLETVPRSNSCDGGMTGLRAATGADAAYVPSTIVDGHSLLKGSALSNEVVEQDATSTFRTQRHATQHVQYSNVSSQQR